MLLPMHIVAGALAMILGAVALLARKGARLHRRSGGPGAMLNGVPFFMLCFIGTIMAVAAAGDVRVVRSGPLRGPRLARHLWRMCFAVFIAAGSFFSVQARVAKILPEPLTTPAMCVLPIALVLILMCYCLWRVRGRWYPAGQPELCRRTYRGLHRQRAHPQRFEAAVVAGAGYAPAGGMPDGSNERRAPTIAEVADYLAREADATIQHAEGLRRELDERLAALEKTLRDVQWLLNHPAYGGAR